MSIATSEPVEASPLSRGFGGPTRIVLTVLAIFFASQFVSIFAVELFASVFGLNDGSVSVLNNSSTAQFFYILIAEALAVAGVLTVLRHRNLGLASIGLARRLRWRDLAFAAVGFIGFVVTLIIVTAVISAFWHGYNTNQAQDVGFKTAVRAADKAIAFVSLVLLPPLGEEILMRGYLFSGLRARWSFVIAGLVTSVLFGAAHLLTGNGGLLWAAGIDTFVLSLFLVYLRERTGALYAGMMVHALNNVLAFIVYFHS